MFALTIKNELTWRIQIYDCLLFANFFRFYQELCCELAEMVLTQFSWT